MSVELAVRLPGDVEQTTGDTPRRRRRVVGAARRLVARRVGAVGAARRRQRQRVGRTAGHGRPRAARRLAGRRHRPRRARRARTQPPPQPPTPPAVLTTGLRRVPRRRVGRRRRRRRSLRVVERAPVALVLRVLVEDRRLGDALQRLLDRRGGDVVDAVDLHQVGHRGPLQPGEPAEVLDDPRRRVVGRACAPG